MLYNLAKIEDSKIINVIVCEDYNTYLFPEWIRIDNISPEPGIGWVYENGIFIQPAPIQQDKQKIFTKFGFRSRFTLQELVAIDNFNMSSLLDQNQKATVNTIIKNFDSAENIDLTYNSTITGIQYLSTVGLLTDIRANEILTP